MLCVMSKTPQSRLAPPSRRAAVSLALAALLLVALVLGLSQCSSDGGPGGASTSPSDTATGDAPSLQQRAVPFEVRYRRVAGDIRKARGQGTLRAVSAPVRAWIDAGFVRGPWPRQAFGEAFAPFGRDITATAHRDADLLTLKSVGPKLVAVVPQRRQVGVSVTGVRGRVVGATARVNVRVLGLSRAGERTAVSVQGDVFLTHVESHGWKIFGYQLDRWVGKGAMTRPGPKSNNESHTQSDRKSDHKPARKPAHKPDSKGKTRGGS